MTNPRVINPRGAAIASVAAAAAAVAAATNATSITNATENATATASASANASANATTGGSTAIGGGASDIVPRDQGGGAQVVVPVPEVSQADPPSPWEHGRAKAYLRERFNDRHDPINTMKPEAVWNLQPALFQRHPKKKFKSRLYSLRKSIQKERSLVDHDENAYSMEEAAFPRPALTERGRLFWDRSEAQRVLRVELESYTMEARDELKPGDLYDDGPNRDEYRKYDREIFRNHFYKLRTSLKAGVFWQIKRNRKGRKQHELDAVEETKDSVEETKDDNE